ncbi:MAG: AsmA-like C-terminal domain-containing protein, partial [Pseudomonadota bacterium]
PVRDGEVEFTAFRPRGMPTFYRFSVDGDVRDMLSRIDEAPLSLISPTGLTPNAFSGEAMFRIEIERPNRRDPPRSSYQYRGSGAFKNLKVEELYGAVTIEGADGNINLTTEGMTVNGAGVLSDAPIKIEWRQRFAPGPERTRLKVSGEATSALADIFGFGTRQFLQGGIGFVAEAIGNFSALRTLNVSADLTNSSIRLEPVAWRKPAGEQARSDFQVDFIDNGVRIHNIRLSGEGVNVSGELSLDNDGRLQTASFPRLQLDSVADLSVAAERRAGAGLQMSVSGPYLNIGPALASMTGNADASAQTPADLSTIDWGDGVRATTRIDRLELRNDVSYQDFIVEFLRNKESTQQFSVSALDARGEPLSARLEYDIAEAEVEQSLVARTANVGERLSGVFGLTSIDRGQGVLVIGGLAADAPLTGELQARDMIVVGAPMLARIFAAGSFDGLSNLLNGEGIELAQAFAEFQYEDGVLLLDDVRVAGPSVGLSAEGQLRVDEGGLINLRGAIAPLYQVNSLLGRTPVIGDLLINREGEGVVAVSYRVTGPASSPTVSVNPLSALTPGAFRRIFESDRDIRSELPRDVSKTSGPTQGEAPFVTSSANEDTNPEADGSARDAIANAGESVNKRNNEPNEGDVPTPRLAPHRTP